MWSHGLSAAVGALSPWPIFFLPITTAANLCDSLTALLLLETVPAAHQERRICSLLAFRSCFIAFACSILAGPLQQIVGIALCTCTRTIYPIDPLGCLWCWSECAVKTVQGKHDTFWLRERMTMVKETDSPCCCSCICWPT